MTFESVKDIQSFISTMIATKIDAGQVVNMHWAVTDVLNEYSDIEGGDVDFYLITARQYVFEQVKKMRKKIRAKPRRNKRATGFGWICAFAKGVPSKTWRRA